LASIIGRIDINAFYASGKALLQCPQSKEIVSMNQEIIKDILVTNALLCMIRKLWILQQNPWLQARAIVLADPGEFKSGVLRCHGRVQ
jgi:hypothetical protein